MILDFSLFFLCKNCNPLFPRNPPLKMEILSIPSIFENLAGDSTPHPPPSALFKQKGGANYVEILFLNDQKTLISAFV